MTTLRTMTRPSARTLLLAGVALVAIIAMSPTHGAFAAGGSGGGFRGRPGGAGGTPGNPNGGDVDNGGGGGGGGPGGRGGNAAGAAGGGGGATQGPPGPNGENGQTGFAGGGGGGGGANGTMTDPTGGAGGRGGDGGSSDSAVGGGGGGGGAGGYGLVVEGGRNGAAVTGGNGGDGGNAFANGQGGTGGGGDGGIGANVIGNNATFTNASGGAIRGGDGGQGGTGTDGRTNGAGGLGGAGVSFSGNNATLINSSNALLDPRGSRGPAAPRGIGGGRGGVGALGSGGASGGNGVEFLGANGSLINATIDAATGGAVRGGVGGANNANGALGGTGGIGVFFANGGTLTNQANASIIGGLGGIAGFANPMGGPVTSGTAGTGGAGVAGSNLTITNAGVIFGGGGGTDEIGPRRAGFGNGGDGGVGISGNTLTITNAATGTISGGDGNGVGVNTLIGLRGGNGGIGILANGAVITNVGTIRGGNGGNGADSSTNGIAAIGIAGSNLTIDNTGGTISGGLANNGAPGAAQAYAIQLNSGTNFIGTGGTINGGIYVAGGSFQPALNGSAPGTPLAVNGPIAFAPGSFYNVRITPRANDSTIASGAATLTGATVNVLAGNGNYRPGTRTILTADGGLDGTRFSGVTTNLAFLRPTLGYDANNVFLILLGGSYASAARTDNQIAVATGLDSAASQPQGRDGRRIFNALNQLTGPQARAAFDSLSGEGIAAAQNVANRSTQLFTSAIFDQTAFYANGGTANSVTLTEPLPGFVALAGRQPVRELADLPAARVAPVAPLPAPTRTWRAWATGFGGVENISGNARIGSAAQRNDIYGGALGVDYQVTPNYLLGVAVGGSNGNFRVDQRGTTGSTTGGHIAIYDLYELGNWYGASSSSFSYFGNQTTRFVNGFGGLGTEQNRGNFNSNEFRSRIEIGRHFAGLPAFANLPAIAGFGTITPFVAIELASLRSNGFTETPLKGGPGLFRLNVSGQSASSAPGFVGLRFQRITPFGGMVLSPTLQVAYVHEFAPYRNQIGTLASLPGSTFLVDGARPARDAAQVKAGAELALGPHSAVFANFDGEFSGVNQLYAGKGGFRYVW